MNNADWLEETTADTSGRIFFSEEGAQQRWDELDPIEAVVLYSSTGEKTYGERWEFGVGREFDPEYSYKIVESRRFGEWKEFKDGVTLIPDDGVIVECALIEYDEYSYMLDNAEDIDWDNVEEFRVLLNPEND